MKSSVHYCRLTCKMHKILIPSLPSQIIPFPSYKSLFHPALFPYRPLSLSHSVRSVLIKMRYAEYVFMKGIERLFYLATIPSTTHKLIVSTWYTYHVSPQKSRYIPNDAVIIYPTFHCNNTVPDFTVFAVKYIRNLSSTKMCYKLRKVLLAVPIN